MAATLETLNRQELACLRLHCQGCDRTTIARRVYVQPNTVKQHLSAAYRKLGIHAQAPGYLACYLMGMADVGRVLDPDGAAMRAEAV